MCVDGASYTTTATWLPSRSPDGLELEYSTTVVVGSQPVDVAQNPSPSFLLAELSTDGEVGAMLRISLDAGSRETPSQAGFSEVTEEATLDRVRGRPGSVVRIVNRGDSQGVARARWVEGGVQWSASGGQLPGGLGVDELAAALEPLELAPDRVRDPSGRFTVISGTPPSSMPRFADLGFRASDATKWQQSVVTVRVDPPVAGADGLPDLATGDGATFAVIDGRPVSYDRTTAITFTEDNSVATATITADAVIAAASGAPGATDLSGRDLVAMLHGLRPVEPDAAELVGVPMIPDWYGANGVDWESIVEEQTGEFCREP